MGFRWAKTLLVLTAIEALVSGCCLDIPRSGRLSTSGATGGVGSSTGSTTSSATSVVSTAASSSTGGISAGSTSSSGGSTSGSAAGSSTGTSGGTGSDGGACGPASDLETLQLYLPGLSGLGLSNSADLNGDGLLDVVVGAYSAGFTVLFGLSDGGMSEPVSYPADPNGLEGPILLADINHDGQPDLLYAGSQEIDILLNNAGNLEQLLLSIPTTGVATVALASGDLDRDGLPDVVDGEETGNGFVVNAFMGLSDGGFSAAIPILTLDSLSESPLPSTLLVGDLNQDGYPDVVAANLGGVELGVVIHQPDGGYESMIYTFDGPITAALLPRVQGAPDLAVGIDQTDSQSGTHGVVQILVNAGDGHFTVSGTHKVTNLAEQLAVADFNGDCIPDVVVGANGCPVAEGLSVLYGRKDGDLGDPQPLPTADQNLTGVLSVLGPVAAPRALGSNVTCSGPTEVAFVVYGDASRH